MRPLTIIGNWKMNGSLAANQQLIEELLSSKDFLANLQGMRTGLCVPYPYLSQVSQLLANSPIACGAQDVSDHPNGKPACKQTSLPSFVWARQRLNMMTAKP